MSNMASKFSSKQAQDAQFSFTCMQFLFTLKKNAQDKTTFKKFAYLVFFAQRDLYQR